MRSRRAAMVSGLGACLLALLFLAAFFAPRGLFVGTSPIGAIIAASNRLATAASNDSLAIGPLMVIAIGFTLLGITDRRRRAKGRQAAA